MKVRATVKLVLATATPKHVVTLEYVKKLARQDQASKYALGCCSQFGIRTGSISRMKPDLADEIKDDENDDEFMSLALDESFSSVLF